MSAALRERVQFFIEQVEAATAERQTGGQQVTPSLPFGQLTPSVKRELRWWARAFEEALRGEETK